MLCLNLDDTLDMVYICIFAYMENLQGLLLPNVIATLPQIAVELYFNTNLL